MGGLTPKAFGTGAAAALSPYVDPAVTKFPDADEDPNLTPPFPRRTGCATCGAPRSPSTGATGCGCSARRVVGRPYVDPILTKMPFGTGGIGRLALVAPRGGRTGAVYMGDPLAGTVDAYLRRQSGETADEASQRVTLYNQTSQRTGESDAAWAARVQSVYAGLNATWKAWIDAMRRLGRLPAAPAGAAPAASSATTAQNQQAVINGVVSTIASAGGTVLALVREANAHDAQVRQQEAEAAAARIARNDSREAMLIAAVTEATGAGYDAQTALRTLRNGDRTRAIELLSAAQGRLAAAIGTSSAFPGSTMLVTAISSARSNVSAAATEIDRSAPVGTPPSNPLNTAPTTVTTPWYKQPLAIVAGVAAVAVGVLAGRR